MIPQSFEERFKNSGDLNSEVGKRVGQQLLLLQAEVRKAMSVDGLPLKVS